MATTSFAEADQPTTKAPEAAPTGVATAIVPQKHGSEIVPDSFFENEGVEGCWDKSDIKLPRLNLVQSVGPLSGELGFTPGHFVFNKEASLGVGPVKITLFKLYRYLQEDIPFGTEVIPQIFRSAEEARAAGFLDVREKKKMGDEHKYVKPVLDADLLIEAPTADNAAFPLEFDGKSYAIARWTLQSTAYSRVGKSFFTDSQLALRAGLMSKFYHITAKREKLGANWVFVPRAQIAGKNSDEFIAWVKSMTSAS